MPGEYVRKARAVGQRDNGTPSGSIGPLEQTIRDYGGITPFIAGHYGEINSQLDDFLKQTSRAVAPHMQQKLYVGTTHQAHSVILWALRRKLVGVILRANIDCFQHCMQNSLYASRGTHGNTARARRRRAGQRLFAHNDPYQASFAYQRTFRPFTHAPQYD